MPTNYWPDADTYLKRIDIVLMERGSRKVTWKQMGLSQICPSGYQLERAAVTLFTTGLHCKITKKHIYNLLLIQFI